ncbi:uncharacterized protein EHS24_006147 [Apiotrichum porosum]|uniref:Uncharacterized protein n=1 Tax=Apiotrichum porosum TaxID=105984 RepID=A0A427Y0Q6_9TREE|nr:uncharacterized protein EHS24_006147 [Apiotrichum porosum]RSH84623.1 hypothetical protein EHS24_006147 [Apiotrichum porosum]
MRKYLQPTLVPLLLRPNPPTAYELWLVGGSTDASLGVYFKIAFVAGEALNAYGFAGRRRLHLADFERSFECSQEALDVEDPLNVHLLHAALPTARVHSVPQSAHLYVVPRLRIPPAEAERLQCDTAIHLSELLLVRILGTLKDSTIRAHASPWTVAQFAQVYAPGNSKDQATEAISRRPMSTCLLTLASDIPYIAQQAYMKKYGKEILHPRRTMEARELKAAADAGDELAQYTYTTTRASINTGNQRRYDPVRDTAAEGDVAQLMPEVARRAAEHQEQDIAAGDIDAIQKQYDKAAKQDTYDKTRHSGMSVVALNQKRRATTALTSRLWPRRLARVAASLRAVYLIIPTFEGDHMYTSDNVPRISSRGLNLQRNWQSAADAMNGKRRSLEDRT